MASLIVLSCAVGGQSAFSSDLHVLSEIAGDSTVGENIHALRQKLAGRSDDDQYQSLADWVVPGRSHLHFRLQGSLTTANPAFTPVAGDGFPEGQLTSAADHKRTRMQVGGDLVSPAFDLVNIAKVLGRLGDLRSLVEQIETTNDADRRSQLALLSMINVARKDDSAATTALTQLFDIFRTSEHSDVSERWPETLALNYGLRHAPHLTIIGELLYLNYEKFVNDLHGWRKQGNDVWDSHLFSLLGQHQRRENSEAMTIDIASPLALKQWKPVSRFTAETRGQGMPPSHWHWDGNEVSRVSGHDQDYLMFQCPVLGNFEIECEVSSTSWREMELLVAGRWVGTYWNRAAFEIGNVRIQRPRVAIQKPMSKFGEWSRYRVVVRDGVYSIFFNGRKLHEEEIGDTFDPWIAIRCEARSLGAVRDLRITGSPIVPESVNLAEKKALPGWVPYYKESVSDDGEWRQESDEGAFGIVGRRQPELAGTQCESLLQCHRPMLENGTIEYEFFYEPGHSHVHPAMDRLTFLLDPAGVNIHHATDGVYERSDLGPGNRSSEPDNRRGTGPLPLKVQGWNRVRLTLRDDTVILDLNGEPVYERKLEATNQRMFGLFHYSDQTEARVRNIVWRGDWPKQIPPLHEQELFVPDHECLDGLDTLTEVFTHRFADEIVEGEFEVSGARTADAVSRHSNGLKMALAVANKWTGLKVNYLNPVYGDFDATLTFEDLVAVYGGSGSADQMLLATDESGMTVRTTRSQSGDDRSSVASVLTLPLPDGTKRYVRTYLPDETLSGTLRIVRRGSTIYSLCASGDSTNFRYVGSHELPSAASAILLGSVTSSNAGGATNVVLRKFQVRSNTSAFEQQIDARVTSVNQFTALLPKTHRHRFAASEAEGFSFTGELKPVKGDGGLRVHAGNDSRTGSATLSFGNSLTGDFDVSTTLNASGLRTSDSVSGMASMMVVSGGERATLSIRRTGKASFEVTASVQRGSPTKRQTETIATEAVSSIDSLRLVRIQKTMLFVYSEGGLSRLLGQASFESNLVPSGGVQLRIEPQSGEVLWKSFEARMSNSSK
tara:strand:- start:44067 stop:47252 length:3186 start_codon:yes stop_codon:yes gene_type:complete